ncbi:MAG TPA: TetR/AcrR family transcriptional regulator [Candidatus Goldiibacteriota bacterium]|jgi:AcrR family transcriptional regulator|nr:TetR/AcrR family transcriptional regulator [Candidatus Goldiibacteriota bacterium]HRQ43157.1 TetR/AcrR family transcriptional regulator [Candidatus Goldiibacteriota bacterium]
MSNTQNNKKITAKGRETKDKIFRTAVELFSKNGFYGVSIRDITSAINIKESSLYHHYLSKEDLINDIYFYFAENIDATRLTDAQIDSILAEHDGHSLLQKCLQEFRGVMEQPLMAMAWRIISMQQYRDDKAFEILSIDFHRMRIKYYENIFRTLVKRRIIKALDPKLLAFEYFYTLIGMLTEYNVLKFLKRKTQVMENLMNEHIEFFWNKIKNS